jgi:uncharacterized damage-inducible protein DinB
MNIVELLLPEFDGEMEKTRRILQRVPEDRLEWRPHEKSMPFGALATHVVNLLTWAGPVVDGDELDLAALGGQRAPAPDTTNEALLARFDRVSVEAREKIAALQDDTLMRPWSLRQGERVYFTTPKIFVLRAMVFSHHVHHRSQLSLYLRLNDIAVPQMYGPSADEPL